MVPPAVRFLPAVLAGLAVRAGHAGEIRECFIYVHLPKLWKHAEMHTGAEGL